MAGFLGIYLSPTDQAQVLESEDNYYEKTGIFKRCHSRHGFGGLG